MKPILIALLALGLLLVVGDVIDHSADVVVAGVVVVLFSLFGFRIYKKYTCPKCKRWWALKTTGAWKKPITGEGFWREQGLVASPGYEKVKCKYCGDLHWREKYESTD
jgi:hypothetical protein